MLGSLGWLVPVPRNFYAQGLKVRSRTDKWDDLNLADTCQHFQFSWFHSASEPEGAYELFRKAFGVEPERSNRNKFPNQSNPVLSSAEGMVGEYIAVFQEMQGRYDIILRADDGSQSGAKPKAFPTFGARQASKYLLENIGEREVHFPKCYRQAVVVHFIQVAEDLNHANAMFFKAIETEAPDGSLIDLLYQYNKRILREQDNLLVNRLVRHSVEKAQFFTITTPVPPGVTDFRFNLDAHVPDDQAFAHQTLLDINNHPDGRIIERDQQVQNFTEFFELGLSVAKGE